MTVLSLEFHPILSSDVPENGANEGSEKGYVCRISLETIQALCLLRDVNNVEVVVA